MLGSPTSRALSPAAQSSWSPRSRDTRRRIRSRSKKSCWDPWCGPSSDRSASGSSSRIVNRRSGHLGEPARSMPGAHRAGHGTCLMQIREGRRIRKAPGAVLAHPVAAGPAPDSDHWSIECRPTSEASSDTRDPGASWGESKRSSHGYRRATGKVYEEALSARPKAIFWPFASPCTTAAPSPTPTATTVVSPADSGNRSRFRTNRSHRRYRLQPR
jgi:hypothetical protein